MQPAQAGMSGVGRTACVEKKVVECRWLNCRQRPWQFLNEKIWRHDRRRGWDDQRACQADIRADRAKVVGNTIRGPMRRGRRNYCGTVASMRRNGPGN